MPKHHTIISGTGRTGTTFLVQPFTALRLDTGFTDYRHFIFSNCDAGQEINIRLSKAPYIVKSPMLCDDLERVIAEGKVVIDHAIVPIRDLFAAAESRRDVDRRTDRNLFPSVIPGGLWCTDAPENQEQALAVQLHRLMHTLAKHDIPLTLLDFPRLVLDSEYLYRKVKFLLGWTPYSRFAEVFREVSRPELVHDFRRSGQTDGSPAG